MLKPISLSPSSGPPAKWSSASASFPGGFPLSFGVIFTVSSVEAMFFPPGPRIAAPSHPEAPVRAWGGSPDVPAKDGASGAGVTDGVQAGATATAQDCPTGRRVVRARGEADVVKSRTWELPLV